jgi:hypothetical protein
MQVLFRILFVIACLFMNPAHLMAQTGQAQPAQAGPLTVTGTLDIKYQTRVQQEDGVPVEGVRDEYILALSAFAAVDIEGKIYHLPTIFSTVLGREKQQAQLSYDLAMLVRNPQKQTDRKQVGKLVGTVPIDRKGIYQYGNGTLRMAVDAAGKAAGFESKFQGQAAGKPPQNDSTLARAKKKTKTLVKSVKGKSVKIVVSDYDEMDCVDLIVAAGPVKAYPETKFNGKLLYDYERSAWYFDGLKMAYVMPDGNVITDTLSGNIKWIESPQRSSNGEGEYQFDVRVNEPAQAATDEAAAFAAVDDESAFFTVDNTLPSLTGSAKYKDTIRAGGTVTASTVAITLAGNNLTRQQVMALTKLLWLVSIVPMNAE